MLPVCPTMRSPHNNRTLRLLAHRTFFILSVLLFGTIVSCHDSASAQEGARKR